MKSKAGLWIDHRKCLIVFVNNKKIGVKIIKSNLHKHPESIDGKQSTAPIESKKLKEDSRHGKILREKLKIYFKEIISNISDVESILVFGPGKAKDRLLKHIIKRRINGNIENPEVTGNMTGAEIVAKVKAYYCT